MHYQYVDKILEWAEGKEILKKGRLDKQMLKISEECLELQNAIETHNSTKNNLEEIKDAIGDVYITLVIARKMRTPLFDTRKVFKKLWLKENFRTEYYRDLIYLIKINEAELYSVFAKYNRVNSNYIEKLLNVLLNICYVYNLELDDCIKKAYDTISKRTGQIIDGSFVKDE